MRKTIIITTLLAAGSAHGAPLLDIYGGLYTGQTALSGILSSGTGEADVEDDLGYDDGRQTVVYLGLEHAVPILPNLRLKHSTLSDDARGQVQSPFTFGGQVFIPTTNVVSSFDLDYTDLTLYYSPLDNVVKIDLGLTARQIEGDFVIQEDGNPANRGEEKISQVIPMLHVGAYGKLPLTGFYATGEVNVVGYDGNNVADVRAGIGWISDFLLGVELGYSQLSLDVDVDDVVADLEIGGPYLALSLNF
ncbi:MAG: TIGR04219 family outer membrane beta-barrel protein [Alcanivoracaceae bacterium]|jgi:outer membrane protein|nr:TIGR04219 family outer membrane beta-barrel protein [Alcanivoracaceae bacterium]